MTRKAVGTIFLLGVTVGVLFAYSGLASFGAGFAGGFIFNKYYWTEEPKEWVQIDANKESPIYTSIQWAKNGIISFLTQDNDIPK